MNCIALNLRYRKLHKKIEKENTSSRSPMLIKEKEDPRAKSKSRRFFMQMSLEKNSRMLKNTLLKKNTKNAYFHHLNQTTLSN